MKGEKRLVLKFLTPEKIKEIKRMARELGAEVEVENHELIFIVPLEKAEEFRRKLEEII